MSNPEKTLIVVLGPTASGKTNVAIRLAQHFGTEIISADSRQFYKEIPIGTAAPDPHQLKVVKHHFVSHLSVEDDYNVSRYENDVMNLLESKFKSKDIMIMAGGSGLYIDAVCKGIDELPDPDLKLRSELNQLLLTEGIVTLQKKLESLDPEYYQVVDQSNPKRLMRAIEVCIQTGKAYSEQRQNTPKERNFNIVKIGLDVERDMLNNRINRRTDQMIEEGWIEEARSVYHLKYLNALNTVGYKELFAYFDGIMDDETAIQKIKTNTRRYAKRQMTWFRKDESIQWFKPEEVGKMIGFLEETV